MEYFSFLCEKPDVLQTKCVNIMLLQNNKSVSQSKQNKIRIIDFPSEIRKNCLHKILFRDNR